MVPNTHGRLATTRHPIRSVLALVAVLALGLGGWALLGRDSAPSAPATTAAGSAPGGTPAPEPPDAPADRGSRDADRVPAAPQLGALVPAPRSTAAPTTPAPTTTRAPGRPAAPRPPAASTTAPAPAPAAPDPSVTGEVTRLTNAERARAGCGPVRTEPRLAAAALAHSRDMVDRGYFSHTSPDGRGPGDRATAAGYSAWSGENIAAGHPTAAAVVRGWMDSPGHRANILNCASTATGVGFDARKNMWTQMFGSG